MALAILTRICFGDASCVVLTAESYSRVIAQDGSEEQLKNAVKMPNIEYQHADAHQTGLSDHCADLITVAQALHWCVCTRKVLRQL